MPSLLLASKGWSREKREKRESERRKRTKARARGKRRMDQKSELNPSFKKPLSLLSLFLLAPIDPYYNNITDLHWPSLCKTIQT